MVKAGKYVNAPTMITVAQTIKTKTKLAVGKVVRFSGEIFFLAKLPAMANAGKIVVTLPTNIANAIVRLKRGVFAFSPAKADPLFPMPEA